MIIEAKNNLFYGCTDMIMDDVREIAEVLEQHNDTHTVISCLAAMVAKARWDLALTMSVMDDIDGMEETIGDSLIIGLESAEKYLVIAKEGN